MVDIINGKLEKMEFHFFHTPEMTAPPYETRKVMYNPNELKLEYTNTYNSGCPIRDGAVSQKNVMRNPRKLTVNLTFDATGASPSTPVLGSVVQNLTSTFKKPDIHQDIQKFLSAMNINGESHAATYAMVVWGKMKFPCVFTSASVTYKLFRHDGVPLRAVLTLGLLEHIDYEIYKKELRLLSPDLTRAHIVVEGDRIDALCQKYYGDPSLYLEIARVNSLTNKRKLTPGETLLFPPIDKRN